MGNIYWLASYPKSGNTWLRALLANYLENGDQPVDINTLEVGPIASARYEFDDNVGVEASDLTQEEIERYRPFVYDFISQKAQAPRFLKVHDAYTYTQDGNPLFSERATAGAIYMMRNPFDVAVSFAHHSAGPLDYSVRKMGDPEFCFLDDPNSVYLQLRQRLLTWSTHVESWIDQPNFPLLLLRYEDLKADTVAHFTNVIRFCGLDDHPARIERAVEFADFSRLRAQEETHGFREKMPVAATFFRKGVVGSWREQLTSAHVAKLIADHADVMRRFGYLTAAGEPIY